MQQEQLQQLAQQVFSRAGEDPSFREALLADPRAAVERELGISLPADLDVEGIRDRMVSRFQVQRAEGETAELSDEELEAVAGGEYKGCEWLPAAKIIDYL